MTPQERMETIRSLAAQLADLVEWSDDVLSVYVVRDRISYRYSVHVIDASRYGDPEIIRNDYGDTVYLRKVIRLPNGGEISQSLGEERKSV